MSANSVAKLLVLASLCDVLSTLEGDESWAAKYELCSRDSEAREKLLLSYAAIRLPQLKADTKTALDVAMANDLGLCRESVSRWRRLVPQFSSAVRRARPDLY